jgi:phosphatidyl-myo-inositol alpha-mannosyltransferase
MALKIGIVSEYCYPLLGGISENVHNTATQLTARGHRVTIISGSPPDHGVSYPTGIPTRRIGRSVSMQANGATTHFAVGLHVWRDLREVLQEGQFDVLQLHSPLFFTLPPLAVLLGRCARVGTFHSYFESSAVYSIFKGVLQREFLNRLDGVTVVSPSVLRAMSRYFDMDARVIPNGIDTALFNPGVPRVAHLSTDKRTLLFLGRFDPRNGLPFMLRAFAEVHRRLRDVRLVVVGTGHLETAYKQMVPDDLRKHVHFEGAALLNRPSYYASADVFCSPITHASFGITLLEAMACGTPIVATENVGYRDLLEPEEALLVPRDVPAFADAIIQILSDDRLRASKREAGLRKADQFTWSSVVTRLLEYFNEVMYHS